MNNLFENKLSILAELWMNYRDDDQMKDFIQYNDLGLPLAYLVYNELVDIKPQGEIYIDETYGLLINALGIKDDKEFTTLDELLGSAPKDE